tara:strand:+ start:633 stop:1520 length:888 start_codon:yes stop_codon:yes gene_type:complete
MSLLKPTFFIIGAPKCGTTSLHHYLSSHSQITMSMPKEPHYFSTDIENGGIRNKEEYLDCFSHSSKKTVAVGESSTLYLYSKIAVKNIYDFNKESKLIVMIRNPIEIARSFHQVALKVFGETETNFQKAWFLEKDRESGVKIPKGCIDRQLILYGNIASIGKQIERLLFQIPLKNIHFILYDDFKRSTKHEYIKVLRFLKVSNEVPMNFPLHNKSQRIKNETVTKLTNHASYFKKKLKIKTRFNVANKIHKANITDQPLDKLPKNFLLEMDKFFEYDINLLSQLIKKDLSKWRIS